MTMVQRRAHVNVGFTDCGTFSRIFIENVAVLLCNAAQRRGSRRQNVEIAGKYYRRTAHVFSYLKSFVGDTSKKETHSEKRIIARAGEAVAAAAEHEESARKRDEKTLLRDRKCEKNRTCINNSRIMLYNLLFDHEFPLKHVTHLDIEHTALPAPTIAARTIFSCSELR